MTHFAKRADISALFLCIFRCSYSLPVIPPPAAASALGAGGAVAVVGGVAGVEVAPVQRLLRDAQGITETGRYK